jgi:gliding motility-associated-like protein
MSLKIFQRFILSVLTLFSISSTAFTQNQIAFTNLLEVCENDTVIFKDNSTLIGVTAFQYAWDFNGDGVFDVQTNVDSITHVYGASVIRTFDVKLRVITNLNDTLYSLPKTIKINYLPVLLTSGNPSFVPEACKLDTVLFFNNFYVAEGSINNTYWNFNNIDETYSINYVKRAFETAGIYTIKTTAFTDKGCKTTVSSNLTIKEIPSGILTYSGPTQFYNDKSVDLTIAGDFLAIKWNTNEITPSINVKNSGIYSAEITNINNCKASFISDSIIVMEELPISTMNLLTLNDDGKNDVWKIYDIEAYGTCEVSIFDRFGQLVFESNDYKNTWNGRDKTGAKLAEGAYFYTLKASELTETKKGTINILH